MPAQNVPLLKRLLRLRVLLLVNVLVLGFLAVSFGREFVRSMEIERDIRGLQERVASLQAKNLEITELSTAFQTESFIEREARLKLGLKRPGEEVVVVHAPTSDASTPAAAAATPEQIIAEARELEPVANPVKWWYYFFDAPQFQALSTL